MDAYIAGVDTSNYTTSVALIKMNTITKEYTVIKNRRVPIKVKPGELGIRQSEAYFQHSEKLPELLKELWGYSLSLMTVSTKPRDVEESYMPVFKAGEGFARVAALFGHLPLHTFSHQQGHIAAVAMEGIPVREDFVCFHISGGTTEILKVTNEMGTIEKIGGTKDISYGQVIDRVGLKIGCTFPCGPAVDQMAVSAFENTTTLAPIHINGLEINLSGIETQALRFSATTDAKKIAYNVMKAISDSLAKLAEESYRKTGLKKIVFVGGVASSEFIQRELSFRSQGKEYTVKFGTHSADNAVGLAILGGLKYGT